MSEEVAKPKRVFRRGVHCSFAMSGETVDVFKVLLKAFRDDFLKEWDRSFNPLPLTVTAEGLKIYVFDGSRIKLADVRMDKYDFDGFDVGEVYKVKRDELPVTIGLPINDLIYALESAGKHVPVSFDISAITRVWSEKRRVEKRKPEHCPKCGAETIYNALSPEKRGKRGNLFKCSVCGWRGKVRRWFKTERVKVHSLDEKGSKLTVEVARPDSEVYKLNISHVESEDTPLPKMKFDATVKVNLEEFRKKIERISKKCDQVVFSASSDMFKVEGLREGEALAEFKFDKGLSSTILDLEVNGKCRAGYGSKQILSCMPKIGEVATLKFANNQPLNVDVATVFTSVNFWLAPTLSAD